MRTAILAALFCAGAAAQGNVCVTGLLQPVGGPTICMQGETHRLENTRIYLKSSTLNLSQWNGQVVRVAGRDVGLTCTVLEVNDVQQARATLVRCGSPSPSCPIKLKVCPGGLGRWWLWGGFASGYMPVGCSPPDFVDGTVLIATPAITLSSGAVLANCGEWTLQIPNVPALVGVQAWFQGARQDIGPVGPPELTNVETLTLSPFMPPCAPTNC